MEAAKTLLRTTVRTLFTNPRQILIIDALLVHSVLHVEDLAFLLSSQSKDVRALINPLRTARLLSTQTRHEIRVGSNRGSPREYYYIPFHPAIDAIKYRIAKLRRKVESLYQQDETRRKDWRCPRCKAEYEELEILDKIGDDGFYCERCGATLMQNEVAAQDRGNHAKIRKLNIQLAKFDDMIAKVDRVEVPENDFASAWERKKDVPRGKDSGYVNNRAEYVELKREDKNGARMMTKKQETVDVKNLNISLTNSAERERELEQEREKRKAELAKQNMMPVWHAKSAIGLNNGTGTGASTSTGDSSVKLETSGDPTKKEDFDTDEKKVNVEEDKMQDEVAAYMAEMERERLERERKEQEESDEEDRDDDGDDFEDVEFVSTPMSSSQRSATHLQAEVNGKPNGLKRELDDGGSSGVSSEANTPAGLTMGERDVKRVKFENGSSVIGSGGVNGTNNIKKEDDADSDEDEDFEDAM